VARLALGIEYAGENYCGWQRQSNCVSIQQNVETAISFVANHPVSLVCAGRTDKGVHAIEQVAHFDSTSTRSTRAWIMGSNTRLADDIRIKWVREVDESFHARFSAQGRAYRYIILNSDVRSALLNRRVDWRFGPIDHQKMHDCAQLLVGEHDFSSFRAAGCQSNTPNRNIRWINVSRQENFISIDLEANAFLYHMVRNIAGSLISVGMGSMSCAEFEAVFRARNRNLAEPTAPAAGLYFKRAIYPEQFRFPENLADRLCI